MRFLVIGGSDAGIASRTKTVLATVGSEFGQIVGRDLQRHGVKVSTNVEAKRISQVSALHRRKHDERPQRLLPWLHAAACPRYGRSCYRSLAGSPTHGCLGC